MIETIRAMVREIQRLAHNGRTLQDLANDPETDWIEVEANAIKGSVLLAFPDGSVGVTDPSSNAEDLPPGTLRAVNLRQWIATGNGRTIIG